MLLSFQTEPESTNYDEVEDKRLHFFEKRDPIPMMPQGIWQVSCGIVQLSQLQTHGEEMLLGWAKPLTFFGRWFSNLGAYQARALSKVYLKWYSLEEIEASPLLTRSILSGVTRRLRQTEMLLAIAGLGRVEERLIALLNLLKTELGETVEDGTRLEVRFTHQNIADAIGTTRVTVTRLLGNFQREGLIRVDRNRHLVLMSSESSDAAKTLTGKPITRVQN
ncbi:MAG: Crp/Fnr family transcriptional regulator [Cyanobacteria bacterium P01_H01_bin.15]